MSFKRVGFIGYGAMGLPMARNLLQKGFEVHVAAHRNREPVEVLKKAGAIEHSSLSGIVSHCEVLISILPTDQEMRAVLLSSDVLGGLSSEHVLIEMTSGSPDVMKEIANAYQAKGIRVLDAPVSGGTIGADKGTLTVMVGGDDTLLALCKPILDSMAQNIYLVGPVGAGKSIKAINQMLAGIHMIAAAEALALAEKLEIDHTMLIEVIGKSSGASWMLMNKLEGMVNRNFTPGFKHSLMKKDVDIAVREGANLNLPLTSFALQLYKMSEKQFGQEDFSAIGKWILT
jgi:3-hydroxyisobutyrate dehydrogenase-like beta-hydroxyacid dehydrogenase